ncbi:hypothetical protein BDV12DRAFT_168078 [Aspergillus spectabilis]
MICDSDFRVVIDNISPSLNPVFQFARAFSLALPSRKSISPLHHQHRLHHSPVPKLPYNQ